MSDDYEQTADAAEQEADTLGQEGDHLEEEIERARKARDDAYADPVIADPKQDFGAGDGEDTADAAAASHAEDVEAAQDQAAAEAGGEPDQAA